MICHSYICNQPYSFLDNVGMELMRVRLLSWHRSTFPRFFQMTIDIFSILSFQSSVLFNRFLTNNKGRTLYSPRFSLTVFFSFF